MSKLTFLQPLCVSGESAVTRLLLILLLLFVPASAQELTVIRAGRLIDVEKGNVLHDRVIYVRGDKIEKIASPRASEIPAGVRVIDLSKYTVLPGLIDCHTHLVDLAQSSGPGAPLEQSPAQMAFNGARNAKKTLLAGFTTVRDVGTYRAFVDIALRDAINDGTVLGPKMAAAGAYITVSSGGGDVTGLSPDICASARSSGGRRQFVDRDPAARARDSSSGRRFHQDNRNRGSAHSGHSTRSV